MPEKALHKYSLALMISVMVVLMFIVTFLLLFSGTTPPPRATLDIQSHSSTETPPKTQYLVVEGVNPSGSNIKWKDVKVLVREYCYNPEGNTDNCPAAITMVQGKDYTIDDKDGNGKVSKGDTITFHIDSNSYWGYILSLQWTRTGNIMYEETLPSP